MTNFEYIKNMTVEEMAEALQDGIYECKICGNDDCGPGCIIGIKNWLESEQKEND